MVGMNGLNPPQNQVGRQKSFTMLVRGFALRGRVSGDEKALSSNLDSMQLIEQ